MMYRVIKGKNYCAVMASVQDWAVSLDILIFPQPPLAGKQDSSATIKHFYCCDVSRFKKRELFSLLIFCCIFVSISEQEDGARPGQAGL